MGNKTTQFDPTAVEILRASIQHVPFDGWCEAALLAGQMIVGIMQRLFWLHFRVVRLTRLLSIHVLPINRWLMHF